MCRSQGYLGWFLENRDIPLVFVDNLSAVALSQNSLVTKRSKHISLRFHEVREYCRDLCYCPTDLNLADPLTKPLPASKYLGMFKPVSGEAGGFQSVEKAFFCSWL